MNLKRFLGNIAKSYLAISALSVSAFAGADEYYNQNFGCAPQCCPTQCCPPPCCQPECCGSPCCPPPSCAWGYNPPAYLNCGNNCCEGFVDGLGFEVDFLWWRSSVECLELGTEEFIARHPDTALGTETFNGSHFKKPKFKYDPGFRLGINHHCDCWDIALNWTHYHSKASAHGETFFDGDFDHPFTVFRPCWERVSEAFPDFSKGHWTFDLDLVDLEFGSKYYVSCCLSLRPHIGLRGGRIDQGFHVDSFANRSDFPGIGDFDDFESHVHAKNDFLAVGPRIGVDVELNLGCGFSIVGRAAGSILFGKTERHTREFFTSFTDVGTTFTEDELEHHLSGADTRLSRTVTDLAIGLQWDHCFNWCCRNHPVSIAVYWEHHAFYDFNDFDFGNSGFDFTETENPIFTDCCCDKCPGDIFTQGVTVALSVGF